MLGLGGGGARGMRRCGVAAQFGFCSAGSGVGMLGGAVALTAFGAELASAVAGAVLDFSTGIYFGRGESWYSRARRLRALAFVGKFAAGTGRLNRYLR